MQLDRPLPNYSVVYLTARYRFPGGGTKTISLYNTTPEQAIENIERLARADYDAVDHLLADLESALPDDDDARALVARLREWVDAVRPLPASV